MRAELQNAIPHKKEGRAPIASKGGKGNKTHLQQKKPAHQQCFKSQISCHQWQGIAMAFIVPFSLGVYLEPMT